MGDEWPHGFFIFWKPRSQFCGFFCSGSLLKKSFFPGAQKGVCLRGGFGRQADAS
jgi:hypothetical protein